MATQTFNLSPGEQLKLSTAANVQNHLGTLHLTTQRVVWESTDAQAKVQRVELLWSQVKDHQVSSAKSPKAMLKIRQLEAGRPDLIVQLVADEAAGARALLETAKVLINDILRLFRANADVVASASTNRPPAQAPPPAKDGGPPAKTQWKTANRKGILGSVAGGQALSLNDRGERGGLSVEKHRAALLAGDPELRRQYEAMVDGGIVSQEDFWGARARVLAEEEARQRAQKAGTSSQLLSDIQADTDSSGRIKFRLTAQTIRQIFVMYPPVARAYKAMVPTELTEEAFWTRYLQSEYFNRNRGGGGASQKSATDDIFLRYAAMEAEEEKARELAEAAEGGSGRKATLRPGEVDPLVDLAQTMEDHRQRKSEEADPRDAEALKDGRKVVQKFNRHAQMVMNPRQSAGPNGRPHHHNDDNPELATELPELRAPHDPETQPLRLKDASRYNAEGAALATAEADGESLGQRINGVGKGKKRARPSGEGDLAELTDVPFQLLEREPDLSQALTPPDQALSVLREFTKAGNTGEAQAVVLNNYPQDFLTAVHRHFQIVAELLRHFFGMRSLPGAYVPGDPAHEKICRIVDKMNDKSKEMFKLRDALPKDTRGNQQAALLKPLQDMLSKAFGLHDDSEQAMAQRRASGSSTGSGVRGTGLEAPVLAIKRSFEQALGAQTIDAS